MQTYSQTFFAAPGEPIIAPPGSAFSDLALSTSGQKSKLLPLENLRAYLYAAKVVRPTLAPGHPPICKTRQERITPPDQFLLSVEPDARFRLRRMALLNHDDMNKIIIAFMDKYVPSNPLAGSEDLATRIRTANFNIPAPGFLIYARQLPQVNNVMTLAKHTLQVLETTERVLNVVWPKESQAHTFIIPTESSVVPEADSELCVSIYYTKVRERDLIRFNEPMVKMVVLVVPPWAFAGADLYELINTPKFPDFKMNEDGTPPNFTRAQKLWAQIYDCCTAKNCPFFAVTTFANWVFGAFNPSSGWSKVIFTPNIGYADFEPSLLEWVTYWVASAIKYPSSGVPELRNPDNLQVRSANDHPSRILSGHEWLQHYLDNPNGQNENESEETWTTTRVSENVYVTHLH